MNRYTFKIQVSESKGHTVISVGALFQQEFNPVHHGHGLTIERKEPLKKNPSVKNIFGYCVVAEELEARILVQEYVEDLLS